MRRWSIDDEDVAKLDANPEDMRGLLAGARHEIGFVIWNILSGMVLFICLIVESRISTFIGAATAAAIVLRNARKLRHLNQMIRDARAGPAPHI